MEPGDTAGLRLKVMAPEAPGEYLLELYVAQEGLTRAPAARSEGARRRHAEGLKAGTFVVVAPVKLLVPFLRQS
jgi:hypothetical protein